MTFISTPPDHIARELDGYPLQRPLEFLEELMEVSEKSIRERLKSTYLSSDQYFMIAVSPTRDALEGACVIEKPEQVIDC